MRRVRCGSIQSRKGPLLECHRPKGYVENDGDAWAPQTRENMQGQRRKRNLKLQPPLRWVGGGFEMLVIGFTV